MRKFPLLPPDPVTDGESFPDVDSCVRLPMLHCAFVGCHWSCDVQMRTHWEMEKRFFDHLRDEEQGHRRQEMKEIFDLCIKPSDDVEMTALAYYVAAVSEQERQHMPIIGPSVDRRTLTLVCRLAQSSTLASLICFLCGQVHTT